MSKKKEEPTFFSTGMCLDGEFEAANKAALTEMDIVDEDLQELVAWERYAAKFGADIETFEPSVFTSVESGNSSAPVFDSGLAVLDEAVVFVPRTLLGVCDTIQSNFKHTEFSVVCRGEWMDIGFVVYPDYEIPKQEVTGASVDYDNEDLLRLKQDGFNVVLHSHPFGKGKQSFSKADEDHVNTHFKCSLLYGNGTIDDARVVITLDNGALLKLTPRIESYSEPSEVPVEMLERISKRQVVYSNWNNFEFGHEFYNRYSKKEQYNRDYRRAKKHGRSGRRINYDENETANRLLESSLY